MFKRSLLLTTSLLMLAGCGIIGPDYERPSFDMPSVWPFGGNNAEQQVTQDQQIKAGWWKAYNDPVLTDLVREGLANNADLEIAVARVSQAEAQLGYANANRFPSLSLQGNATRGESAERYVGTPTKPANNFNLAGVLNYEVDLWGKLARTSESSRGKLLAADYNRDAVELTVATEVATGYFNLRALDAQIAITEGTIQARTDAYAIEQNQFRLGASNGLTFRQAEAELASTKAALPQLRQSREQQLSALAVLLGRTPKQIAESVIARGAEIDALPVPPLAPPLVAGDLPSTLLERRPDIAAAEQKLASGTADIAVARAAYFPTISLSGLLGVNSIATQSLFDGNAKTWQLGAGAAGPLIDFGRTDANVELAKGIRDEDLANYKQTIRTAFKDVRDALTAQGNTAERQQATMAQENALSETLRLARLRYSAGYSSNLEVLDAQRGLYAAQLDRVTAKLDRLVASVNLYKALGGGWSPEGAAAKPEAGQTDK